MTLTNKGLDSVEIQTAANELFNYIKAHKKDDSKSVSITIIGKSQIVITKTASGKYDVVYNGLVRDQKRAVKQLSKQRGVIAVSLKTILEKIS